MVTFTGKVSGQAVAGETVTIAMALTNPDATTQTITCVTDEGGNFSGQADLPVGDYTAQASIGVDATFKGAKSDVVSFNVSPALMDRTITLTVAQ